MLGMAKRKAKKPAYTPEQIHAIRTRLQLTQTEAAEKLGATLRTWQYWESGERNPSPQAVLLLKMLADGKL